MKILHYIPSIDRGSGGVGAYMQQLSKELGKLVSLHVVTHKGPYPVDLQNCELHYIHNVRKPYRMKRDFLHLLSIIDPDVVHVNCCWNPECSLVQKWATQHGYKTVYTPHGMLEPWILKRHYWMKKLPALLLYQRAAIRRSTIIHATAESERRNLLNLNYNSNVVVIPNGIDIDTIEMKSDWHRKKKILFLSRVHVKKGIQYLIEAVARLKEQLQGYKVIIAGEGEKEYIDELKSLTVSLDVSEIIAFVGGVYGNSKWDLYRESDLFVLPTHSENFGIVVAEALASGTVVITTKGTPWEILNTSHCGWWIDVGTDYIVQALQEFLELEECDLENMGRNGRKLVEENFSSKKTVCDFVNLYNTLI